MSDALANDPLNHVSGHRWVSWRTTPGAAGDTVPQGTVVEMTLSRPVTKVQVTDMDTGEPVVYDNGDPKMDVSVQGTVTTSTAHPDYVGEEMQVRARILSPVRNPDSLFAALVDAQRHLGRAARAGDVLKIGVTSPQATGRKARVHFRAKFTGGIEPVKPQDDPLTAAPAEEDEIPF